MQCSPIDIELNSCLREGALTRVWFGRSVAFLFGLFVRDQAAGEQAAKNSHKAFLKANSDPGTGFGQPRIDLDAIVAFGQSFAKDFATLLPATCKGGTASVARIAAAVDAFATGI